MKLGIKVSNVCHEFRDQIVLDNISIDFEENKIYGLLGKNGEGKTTLLNIISNQLYSKSGSVEILGKNIKENPQILENICIVREKEFSEPESKVKSIFEIYSYFYKNYDTNLQDKLCKHYNINPKKQYKKLSRGMKSIVSNIIGICSNAPITIFDEPTIGLDAVSRQEFYDMILESYVNSPRTIIIATHLIDEVENLLENIVIINNGKVMINDSMENIAMKSYYISGKREDLEKLQCLKESKLYKSFGSKQVYAYYGDLSETDLDLIENLSIELETMSLQDMFINNTKKVGGF